MHAGLELRQTFDAEAHTRRLRYLWQEGVEPQNQLNMAVEQHLHLVNDSFCVYPAVTPTVLHWLQMCRNKQGPVLLCQLSGTSSKASKTQVVDWQVQS